MLRSQPLTLNLDVLHLSTTEQPAIKEQRNAVTAGERSCLDRGMEHLPRRELEAGGAGGGTPSPSQPPRSPQPGPDACSS